MNLAELIESRRAFAATIRAMYEGGGPAARKHIRAATVLEYRCRTKGCLLLIAWRSPQGLLFYQPDYKLSPTMNTADSNESGRARNTLDGDRHWMPTAGSLDDFRGWGPTCALHMDCRHVRRPIPTDDLLAAAEAATPGNTRPTLVG